MLKNTTLFAAAGATLAALAIAGCADEVELAEFLKRDYVEWCSRILSCCDDQEIKENYWYLGESRPTQAECERVMRPLGDGAAYIQDQIAAGRLAYHGDRAAACLQNRQNRRAASCSGYFRYVHGNDVDPDCAAAIEGLVPTGGACTHASQCAAKSDYCAGANPETLGKCIPLPVLGEACTLDFSVCADGLLCDLDTRICVALKPNGYICSSFAECESSVCDRFNGRCVEYEDSPVCDGI